jgi:hypothetical protein
VWSQRKGPAEERRLARSWSSRAEQGDDGTSRGEGDEQEQDGERAGRGGGGGGGGGDAGGIEPCEAKRDGRDGGKRCSGLASRGEKAVLGGRSSTTDAWEDGGERREAAWLAEGEGGSAGLGGPVSDGQRASQLADGSTRFLGRMSSIEVDHWLQLGWFEQTDELDCRTMVHRMVISQDGYPQDGDGQAGCLDS